MNKKKFTQTHIFKFKTIYLITKSHFPTIVIISSFWSHSLLPPHFMYWIRMQRWWLIELYSWTGGRWWGKLNSWVDFEGMIFELGAPWRFVSATNSWLANMLGWSDERTWERIEFETDYGAPSLKQVKERPVVCHGECLFPSYRKIRKYSYRGTCPYSCIAMHVSSIYSVCQFLHIPQCW